MFVKDLESLKYSELQKIAKSAGIKANQKIDRLMKALKDHYLETEDDQENDPDEISNKENGSCSGTANNKHTKSASGENLSEIVSHCATKISTQALSTPLPAKKTVLQDMSTPSDEASNICTRKRRRTFELNEPTLSAQNTPTLEEHSEKRNSKQRAPGTNSQSVVEQVEPAKKRVRKNTYNTDDQSEGNSNASSAEQASTPSNSSPGTKALIEEIDANLPSAERKKRLLAALEKKIKTKAPASPGQRSIAQPSQIPRFMAFLANKNAEAQKPVTPGNKDWTKIHKKEFSKFDSLDIYLEKKQQRMDKLSGSAKGTTNAGPTLRKGSRIVKPVSRLQVPVKTFVPTVTTTKNLTFNFGKTPVNLPSRTPSHQKSKDMSVTKTVPQTPRSTHGPIASAKKPAIAGSKTTPFIFTGNNNSHNTTVTSNKKVFDLKASLSKPLSWKPHSGKLQPVDVNKAQTSSTAVSHQEKPKVERQSRQAMASKTRPVNAKDVRRVKQLDRRNNQKYIDMMKRRGLLA